MTTPARVSVRVARRLAATNVFRITVVAAAFVVAAASARGSSNVATCASMDRAGARARNGQIAYVHRSQVYVVGSDGMNPRQLTNGESFNDWPAWSPDGHGLAYVSEETHGISVMDADGKHLRRVTDNSSVSTIDSDPAWSRDGKIAFIRRGNGIRDIFLVNDDGTGLRQIHLPRIVEEAPSWSPHGDEIVFSGWRDGRGSLYVVDVQATRVRKLLNAPFEDTEPAWSPRANSIAFTRLRRPPGAIVLWAVRPDGRGATQLVRSDKKHPTSDAAWSPDARELVFESFRRGRNELMLMRRDGRSVRRFPTPVYGVNPSWQPVVSGRTCFAAASHRRPRAEMQ